MFDITRKSIYALTRDFRQFPKGTEGVRLDLATIKLIPGVSDKERAEVYCLEIRARKAGEDLLLINNELFCVPMSYVEFVRCDPPSPIFEDEEDNEQWVEEKIKRLMSGGDDASS